MAKLTSKLRGKSRTTKRSTPKKRKKSDSWEVISKALTATGVWIAAVMVMISFFLLVYPYIGIGLSIVAFAALSIFMLFITYRLFRSGKTQKDFHQMRLAVALVSAFLGVINLWLSVKYPGNFKYFWIVWNSISLLLTIRFIFKKSSQIMS